AREGLGAGTGGAGTRCKGDESAIWIEGLGIEQLIRSGFGIRCQDISSRQHGGAGNRFGSDQQHFATADFVILRARTVKRRIRADWVVLSVIFSKSKSSQQQRERQMTCQYILRVVSLLWSTCYEEQAGVE
ncbi:MAG: hypothetical protein ACYS29_06985, partial [Planctomycetota bacterium]